MKLRHWWMPAILLLALFIGWMIANASLLQLRRADAAVPDLPPAFEGRTILYLSDVDLCGLNTAERAADAVMRMQRLNPDMLVLGGDYNSPTLFETLNGRADAEAMLRAREAFFQALSGFSAPMGRYALLSADDRALGDPAGALRAAGFTVLNGDRRQFTLSGQRLWLVGVGSDVSNLDAAGRLFDRGECVICVAETPDLIPRIVTGEAADGGPWADMILAGHTHGGQILAFGRPVLSLTGIEQRFLSGWTRETGIPTLTTSGLGCEGLNLRLGTKPEAWLITLRGA